ncbi:MAG: rRNA maturation RNase YbeY [Candidatus Spechtbacteria bacterium]|nr:rRNA maturation RNase YbeY [Candidatus Spechtbacteria bacterium]
MRIEIQNFTTFSIDKSFVEAVLQKTYEIERKKGIMEISVSFVEKKTMEAVEEKSGKVNHEADVLTFEASRNARFYPLSDAVYLGEIVVCPFVVMKRAGKQGMRFKRELAHVLVHGMLHLFGYRHEDNPKEAERMHKKEEVIMDLCVV